jgi:hypothetical protein
MEEVKVITTTERLLLLILEELKELNKNLIVKSVIDNKKKGVK